MRFTVFFLSLLVVRPAFGADSEPSATIWARNPAAVRALFPADQVKVLDAESESEQWARSGYLPPLTRNAVFHRVQMDEFVESWDDLDKDILVMSSKAEELPLLVRQYPKIPENTLAELQKAVRELTSR